MRYNASCVIDEVYKSEQPVPNSNSPFVGWSYNKLAEKVLDLKLASFCDDWNEYYPGRLSPRVLHVQAITKSIQGRVDTALAGMNGFSLEDFQEKPKVRDR